MVRGFFIYNLHANKNMMSFMDRYVVSRAHVTRKDTLRVQNGTNLKVDFFECLDPPRYHMGKKFGFHRCP